MNILQVQSVAGVLGRALLSAIFIFSGLHKLTPFGWTASSEFMLQHGVPWVPFLLAVAAAVEVVGGVCVLLNVRMRAAAVILAGYLAVVTVIFHGFWAYTGAEQQVQTLNFLKNLAIMGGLLTVASTSIRVPVTLDQRGYGGLPAPSRA